MRRVHNLTIDDIAAALNDHIAYTRGLEKKLKETERLRDVYRDSADPGWRQRDLEAALDGEIRLLREQG